MTLRRTRTCIVLMLGLSLAGCGSPNDIPTADDGGLRTVAQVGTTQPTPTLVPTAAPSPTSVAGGAVTPTTPSASPSAVPTAEPTVTTSPTPSASPTPDDDDDDDGHPIAQLIADEFGVSVAEVEGYHAQGIGYGILAQFYSIAYQRCDTQASYTVDQLVAMKQSGMGMGEIRKQALGSAAANECSLGRLKQDDLDAADRAQGGPPDDKGNKGKADDKGNNGKADDNNKADDKGNNGKADDKGNNGKADDKGNGGGNGGGKGNGGNGGGKGKGK